MLRHRLEDDGFRYTRMSSPSLESHEPPLSHAPASSRRDLPRSGRRCTTGLSSVTSVDLCVSGSTRGFTRVCCSFRSPHVRRSLLLARIPLFCPIFSPAESSRGRRGTEARPNRAGTRRACVPSIYSVYERVQEPTIEGARTPRRKRERETARETPPRS